MASIKGVDGMSPEQISFELNRGGKFVIYRYCFSAIVITMRMGTDVYLVRAEENRVVKSLPWTLLTLVVGWWGIPWGPIYTVQSLWTNLHGGTDVTAEIVSALGLPHMQWDVAGASQSTTPPQG